MAVYAVGDIQDGVEVVDGLGLLMKKNKIQVFAGGELVPPLGVFDAVSEGTVECGSGASYYWAGKVPAAQWFAAVPFGFNPQGINAWFYSGGGLQLWEEVYAPFNVIPRPQGNTGVQMGGWFRKDMNTIDDYKGLKMRIPGLGGKVISKAGGTVVLLPGGETWIGCQAGDPRARRFDPEADPKDGPPRRVRLSAFFLAAHEVTQAQWQGVMGSNPSSFEGADRPVDRAADDRGVRVDRCSAVPAARPRRRAAGPGHRSWSQRRALRLGRK